MAIDDDAIHYIERTAYYYSRLGFGRPYEWEHNSETPFAPLKKPLSDCVVAIVTTAAPFKPNAGNQGPNAPYNADAKFYNVYRGTTSAQPDLRISHVAIDRDNTSAEDIGTYFPLVALQQAAAAGRINAVCDYFYGLPTNRSKRTTREVDSQELLEQCTKDGVDALVLVPNCPVCHQSVSIASRTLEAAGISTVVMGCAKDIVKRAGVARFLFNDFPLGNSAGRPNDEQSQSTVMHLALDLLEAATQANTTWQSPLEWIGNKHWKTLYSNPDLLSDEELEERKASFQKGKDKARALRESTFQQGVSKD